MLQRFGGNKSKSKRYIRSTMFDSTNTTYSPMKVHTISLNPLVNSNPIPTSIHLIITAFAPKSFMQAALLGLLFCCTGLLSAQTLRGTVRDADTGSPIANAGVTAWYGTSDSAYLYRTTATNPAGEYELSSLKPGYFRCEITAEGFDAQYIVELNVSAGKQKVVDVALRRASTKLPEITITANNLNRRAIQPLGEIPLSRDQTLRYPSMYFDPGRLAAAYPGVTQTDDGINGMTIRGNNPNAVRWRIGGVDVVNPNHLPNAGTFSDLPAGASGGVLLFSAQLLDNSALITGNYPAQMGDALGGVMDMNLRPGNNKRPEFTAQVGLIGLDVAAEGPFSKKPNAPSYLVNYRYSTVGLLGQLGVSFGDEQINFQDLSYHVNVPGKRGGGWGIFGMFGRSENLFTRKDSADVARNKDNFDITFTSKTAINGVNGLIKVGAKTWLKPVFIISEQKNQHLSEGLQTTNIGLIPLSNGNDATETRASGSLSLQHNFTERMRMNLGTNVANITYKTASEYAFNNVQILSQTTHFETVNSWAWLRFDWKSRSEKTSISAGVNYAWLSVTKDAGAFSPSLSLTQQLTDKQRITVAVSQHAQMQPLWAYRVLPRDSSGRQPGYSRATHFGIRHTFQFSADWVLKTELYRQQLFDLPIGAANFDPLRAFALLNYAENQGYINLENAGEGLNQGIEITIERYLRNGWFMMANASLFDSKVKTSDRSWRATRWNTNHLLNIVGGREWRREKTGEKTRFFGINGRAVWTGGLRAEPVDPLISNGFLVPQTYYNPSNGFSEQLPDYFRIDLRVYWKKNLGDRRNSTFAMDFQNVTMQKNVAYYYWEPFTKKIATKYQLGLIPNLSWRLEF